MAVYRRAAHKNGGSSRAMQARNQKTGGKTALFPLQCNGQSADSNYMFATPAHPLAPDATLLRTPSRELQVLVWSKQLLPTRFDDYRAVCMLSDAMHLLEQARDQASPPQRANAWAHHGLYQLCLACLYLHGLRLSGKEGQKEMVLQWGMEQFGIGAAQRAQVLSARHLWLTQPASGADACAPYALPGLLATAKVALTNARQRFGDWFY